MPLSFTIRNTKYSVGFRPSAAALLMWGANLFLQSAVKATSVIVEITSPMGTNDTGAVQFDWIDSQIVGNFENAANTTLGSVKEISNIPTGFSALQKVCKVDGPQQIWASFRQFANSSFIASVTALAEQSCVSENALQSFRGWKGFVGGAGYISGAVMAIVFMLQYGPQRLKSMETHYFITLGLEAAGLLGTIIPLSNASRMEIMPSAIMGFVAGGLMTPSIGVLIEDGPKAVAWIKSHASDCAFFAQSLRQHQEKLVATSIDNSGQHSEEYQSNL